MEPQKQNDGVRYKLANAMKECMRTAPVEKITVKEIVETCGLTRQTFYRNFQDKYDLINWYFDVLAQMSFKQMGIRWSSCFFGRHSKMISRIA